MNSADGSVDTTIDVNLYRHTQVGWPMIVILAALPPIAYFAAGQDSAALLVPAALIVPLLALFGTLTIDVDDRRFRLWFGIGLIRRTIPVNIISAYAPARSPWYYGWGIRLMRAGILYNVSSGAAVELLLHDGRRVRVGTDEPEAVMRALEAATGLVPTSSVDEFPTDRRWVRRTRLIAALTLGVVALWLFGTFYVYRQPLAVTLTADRFAVRVGLHRADMPIAAIQSVQLLQDLPRIGRRTNGFAGGGLLRGTFVLDQWGRGHLFINRSAPPFLVAKTQDTFVAVNFDDATRTRDLYNDLRLRVLVHPHDRGVPR